jgi:anti-sigma factor RsiW
MPPEQPAALVDEQLSAWLDDELPSAELELLAARLAGSEELRGRVARYGLIGGVLRGGPADEGRAGLLALTLAERVGARLDSEGAVPAPAARASRLAPFAAAAGVALLAVTLVPVIGTRPAAGPGPAASLVTPARMPVAFPAATVPQASLSPRRLTNYLVYHGEYSGTLSAKLTDSHIVNNRAYVIPARTTTEATGR